MSHGDKVSRIVVVVLCLLVVALSATFYVQLSSLSHDIDTARTTLQEATQTLSSKVDAKVQSLEESDAVLADVMGKQKTDLMTRIIVLENKSNSQIQNVLGQLQASELRNQQLVTDLEKNLGQKIQKLNVQSSDFSTIISTIIRSVVSVITDQGQGSGVFVYRQGYLITNHHVIENAQQIRVLTYDGKQHTATPIAFNAAKDIALLRIDDTSYPLLPLANSDSAQVGERVVALGNPGGLGFTVTEGIVSAVNRNIGGSIFIQTDVPINPGNSGGALVNTDSEVLGINTFKISNFEGVGFAVPSNVVKQLLDEIFAQIDAQS